MRADQQKQIATQFKEEKKVEKQIKTQQMREKEEEEKKRVLEELRKNKDKVDQIQQKEIEKVEEKHKILQQKARQQEMLQQRLDQAVENYSFRPMVEADKDRLIKETAAREIRKVTINDAADQVRLFHNPGYTIDGLMKDIRYKVSTALAEAGLHNTAYGKEVLRGLASGVAARPDMIGNKVI